MSNSQKRLSVIVPLYNEEENVRDLFFSIREEVEQLEVPYEVILVNDGSTDNTLAELKELEKEYEYLNVVSYPENKGRGKALREGFNAAEGEYIITIDADLSYSTDHITKIYKYFKENDEVDAVIGSPYMKGGRTENVPFLRLLISRVGNIILRYAVGKGLHTISGILRGYKKDVIKSLLLESNGKEIHLEIVSKLIALNYNIQEMPAVLRGRKKGKSKFKFRATAISHLIYSFYDRPIMLFGIAGTMLLFLGLIGGFYLIYLWQMGTLNPERPLVNLVVLLVLSGVQILAFGFLATQVVILRNEVFKLQKQNRKLEKLEKEK